MPAAHAQTSDAAVSDAATSSRSTAVPLGEAVEAMAPDYSGLNHHQLTEIGARWDELDQLERRALLQEVKLRMARQKGGERVLQIRTQRRYGRIVRRSDGQVLRIETQVVQVKPRRTDPAEQSFGVGFERRHAAGKGSDQATAQGNDSSGEVPTTTPTRRVSNEER